MSVAFVDSTGRHHKYLIENKSRRVYVHGITGWERIGHIDRDGTEWVPVVEMRSTNERYRRGAHFHTRRAAAESLIEWSLIESVGSP